MLPQTAADGSDIADSAASTSSHKPRSSHLSLLGFVSHWNKLKVSLMSALKLDTEKFGAGGRGPGAGGRGRGQARRTGPRHREWRATHASSSVKPEQSQSSGQLLGMPFSSVLLARYPGPYKSVVRLAPRGRVGTAVMAWTRSMRILRRTSNNIMRRSLRPIIRMMPSSFLLGGIVVTRLQSYRAK